MRNLAVTVLTISIFVAISSSVSAQTSQTIKMGTLAPQGSPWYQALREMAEEWKAVSAGRVQVRIYPGGVAGDDPVMVRKMRIGQLHAATLTGAGLSGITPEISALSLPMMFTSYDEFNYVRERVRPELEALLEVKGFKVLAWADVGWVYSFTERPVIHPDDLKSHKLFVWAGNPAYVDAWRDAGYNPVPLAMTELHMGLQSGLVNAFNVPPIAALSFQWFKHANHMSNLKWAPMVGSVTISTRAWQQIPSELRPALLKAARDAGGRVQSALGELEVEAIEAMKKHGLVVHQVPPEIAALWEERARAGYPSLIGSAVPAGMAAKVERLRDEYRSQM